MDFANVRVHDLRHEATSRLAEKLPNLIELATVTGQRICACSSGTIIRGLRTWRRSWGDTAPTLEPPPMIIIIIFSFLAVVALIAGWGYVDSSPHRAEATGRYLHRLSAYAMTGAAVVLVKHESFPCLSWTQTIFALLVVGVILYFLGQSIAGRHAAKQPARRGCGLLNCIRRLWNFLSGKRTPRDPES